jgi:type VI secretion system protein ImpK
MTERPKDGADPDATVMLPAGGKPRAPDDDATVMIPARDASASSARPDDDATVMIPAVKEDDDATVMIPAAREAPAPSPRPDDDATVMMPARGPEASPEREPDAEATIAIPTPGRKRDADSPALPAAPAAGSEAAGVDPAALGGLNPLVAAANPVLAVVAQIRQTLKHPDPEGLRASLRERVDAFEAAARAAGAGDETVAAASLALCALVDESAAATPWGAGWAGKGLLAERHGLASGSEKFFQLLDECLADPAAKRELLEFLTVCLALDFEGRYRHLPDGRQSLLELRAKALEALRAQRPARDGELSANWRGLALPARRPAGALGLWAAGCGAALLLAALYIGYTLSLGSLSDPVARELAQLKAAPEPGKARSAAAPAAGAPATPRLAEQLKAEIERGEIAVSDAPGTSTIVIRSDRLFASGSARLEPAIEPVVLRVAEALERVPGTVVVTGHTDDVPIRTARFPSNWELSTERANSVVKLVSGRLKDASRLRAEGLADSAPAAPNDSAANRARNRRVELILRSAP